MSILQRPKIETKEEQQLAEIFSKSSESQNLVEGGLSRLWFPRTISR